MRLLDVQYRYNIKRFFVRIIIRQITDLYEIYVVFFFDSYQFIEGIVLIFRNAFCTHPLV